MGIETANTKSSAARGEQYDETNWTPLEIQTRGLISEFTAVQPQDVHKNTAFIHLGVDSISAIRLAKHFRKAGLKVSSADVVRHNRLGALCNHLQSSTKALQTNGAAPESRNSQQTLLAVLAAAGVKNLTGDIRAYECTPLQAGMLAQSLATDGALYMHHHAIQCNADIDILRLKQAWHAVVQDLDVMRTTFHWLPKHTTPWVAVVHADKRPSWKEIEVVDAREHWLQLSDRSDFNARLQNVEPLAGVQLVKSPGSTPVFILSLHHSIYDGISLGMVYRQLSMRYHGASTPQLTPFYEAAETIAGSADSAVKFWTEQVKGYEGAPSTENTGQFTLKERVITTDVTFLEAKCRRLDLDIKDVATVAFGKAMMTAFSRRDVVFGHVVAARLGQAAEGDVVGPVFNTIPLRVTLNDLLLTNKAMVDAVHAVNLESIELQHASLAEVQKRWRMTSTHHSAPLIDSIFVYSKLESGGEYGLETLGQPLESDKAPVPSEYRLNFEVEHTATNFTARALSSAIPGEIETLLEHFSMAIHDMLDNPDRFAAAIPQGLHDLPLQSTQPTAEDKSSETFDHVAVENYADIIRSAMADVAEVTASSIELDSSIYSFGIDSIAAIQIVSGCRKSGLKISVAQILKGATLGRICELVAANAVSSDRVTVELSEPSVLVSVEHQYSVLSKLKLSQDTVEDILPCLPGQQYHLMSWLQSGRTLYEPGWIYKATALDANRLKAAWRKLRERNAALRTTFAAVGPQHPFQVVMKSSAVHDDAFVVHRVEGSLTDAVKSRAHIEARNPSTMFSLPVRLRLVQADDGDAIMLYCHHALYDAWSMPRLVTELASLYLDLEVKEVPSFPQLVRHTIDSTNKNEEKAFWQDSLAGCEKAVIPCANTVTDRLDQRQTFVMAECSAIDVADFEFLCNKHKISPHHILLLAFARALALETNTTSPLFGFFQLGRSAAFDNIEAVTGPCVNALPLGLRNPLSQSVLESARRVQTILGNRVAFEQSSLRSAIGAFDEATKQLPFNAFINILWNTKSLIGEVGERDLFRPMAIGVPTDYSSPVTLQGATAVDELDTSFLPEGSLFLDVGRGQSGVVFGARADTKLMDESGVRRFIEGVEEQIGECLSLLRCV